MEIPYNNDAEAAARVTLANATAARESPGQIGAGEDWLRADAAALVNVTAIELDRLEVALMASGAAETRITREEAKRKLAQLFGEFVARLGAWSDRWERWFHHAPAPAAVVESFEATHDRFGRVGELIEA